MNQKTAEEKTGAIEFGVKLGDVWFSMTVYGVAVGVEGKRDIFRFATASSEDVEISVPWDGELSCRLKLVAETLRKDIMRGR